MKVLTRNAVASDQVAIERLLPRLADFPSPPRLDARQVWRHDGLVVAAWAAGERPQTFARVATDTEDSVVGAAVATMQEDSFTGELAVHLEIIVIDEQVDGHGIGRMLMAEVEREGKARGATVMTLNVMVENQRARGVYAKLGFDEEMIRAARRI